MSPRHTKRDLVFAWMADTGRGARAASSQWEVSLSTIKSWIRRHGDPRKPDPAPSKSTGGATRGSTRPQREDSPPRNQHGVHPRQSPQSQSLAH